MMSEESTFWVTIAEKFFGIVLAVLGAIALYYTIMSNDVLVMFTGFFGFLGVVLLVLGLFLIIVKPE